MSTTPSDNPLPNHRGPSPAEIVLRLAGQLAPVTVEAVDLPNANGRVLGQEVQADRASPSLDVSAMDGYAVRIAEIRPGVLPIMGEAHIGQPPVAQPAAAVVRIVTGAPVPLGAEAVVRREEVTERAQSILIPPDLGVKFGQNIRRRGENAAPDSVVLEPGVEISAAVIGACAAFGLARIKVFRRLRVGLVVTGDELLATADQPQPWQLRDTNGPAVTAMLADLPWVECSGLHHVPDDLPTTVAVLEKALSQSDVVLMTGGVSMGERDFAQVAVGRVGAESVFHGLPIRPGKPMLGAVAPGGQAILGLPGNPVSVLVTARRFALLVLRRLAGFRVPDPPAPCVAIDLPEISNPKAWLYRPVRLSDSGPAQVLATKGSADMVSAANADGFVEITPDSAGQVYRAYYPWRL